MPRAFSSENLNSTCDFTSSEYGQDTEELVGFELPLQLLHWCLRRPLHALAVNCDEVQVVFNRRGSKWEFKVGVEGARRDGRIKR